MRESANQGIIMLTNLYQLMQLEFVSLLNELNSLSETQLEFDLEIGTPRWQIKWHGVIVNPDYMGKGIQITWARE
jgi:hypothetical protein